MKKASAKKSAEETKEKIVSPKSTGKTTARAKASVKAAMTKVTAGAKKAVSKAASAMKKPAAIKAMKEASGAPATIVVRHDAGWGNTLHLRGEGPGLSWDTGTPMCCVNGVEWVWVAPAAGAVTCKVLHNDRAWALGENLFAAPGETVTVTPVF